MVNTRHSYSDQIKNVEIQRQKSFWKQQDKMTHHVKQSQLEILIKATQEKRQWDDKVLEKTLSTKNPIFVKIFLQKWSQKPQNSQANKS